MKRKAPEHFIIGIDPGSLLTESRGLLIGARCQDEAMQLLEAPTVAHEFAGQPVEQSRVGRALAFQAEIARGSHNSAAEMILPDPVYHDARRQRIIRVGQDVRQRWPAAT